MRHTQTAKYKLDKESYLVVQHFAQQYPALKRRRAELIGLHAVTMDGQPKGTAPGDPTGEQVVRLEEITAKIDLIEDVAATAGGSLYEWLLLGVTRGLSYDNLRLMHGIPAGKNMYYRARQCFFWLLDKRLSEKIVGH